MRNFPHLLIAALAFVTMSFTFKSDMRPWEHLGSRKIDYALDRDEIVVTAAEGRFTGLKFMVKRSAINLHKVVIHYGNGETQELDHRHTIPAGGESPVIDLPGNKRVIQKVVFWYDTKNVAARKGVIELWGRH